MSISPDLWITRCCVFFSAYQTSHTLHTDYIPQMDPVTHEASFFNWKLLNSICYHLTSQTNKYKTKTPKPNKMNHRTT